MKKLIVFFVFLLLLPSIQLRAMDSGVMDFILSRYGVAVSTVSVLFLWHRHSENKKRDALEDRLRRLENTRPVGRAELDSRFSGMKELIAMNRRDDKKEFQELLQDEKKQTQSVEYQAAQQALADTQQARGDIQNVFAEHMLRLGQFEQQVEVRFDLLEKKLQPVENRLALLEAHVVASLRSIE